MLAAAVANVPWVKVEQVRVVEVEAEVAVDKGELVQPPSPFAVVGQVVEGGGNLPLFPEQEAAVSPFPKGTEGPPNGDAIALARLLEHIKEVDGGLTMAPWRIG
jgi:hypothetical protein